MRKNTITGKLQDQRRGSKIDGGARQTYQFSESDEAIYDGRMQADKDESTALAVIETENKTQLSGAKTKFRAGLLGMGLTITQTNALLNRLEL